MLKSKKEVEVNSFYEKLSQSPCFASHLRQAVDGGICLYCDGFKRISPRSGGICAECSQYINDCLVEKVNEKWRVSVDVTEK